MYKDISLQKILKLNKVFIVAEISANHSGKITNLKRLIKECKKIGVDAVKIQNYEADDLTINSNKSDFKIDKKSPWKKFSNAWNLYNNAKTPDSWP